MFNILGYSSIYVYRVLFISWGEVSTCVVYTMQSLPGEMMASDHYVMTLLRITSKCLAENSLAGKQSFLTGLSFRPRHSKSLMNPMQMKVDIQCSGFHPFEV